MNMQDVMDNLKTVFDSMDELYNSIDFHDVDLGLGDAAITVRDKLGDVMGDMVMVAMAMGFDVEGSEDGARINDRRH